MAFILFKFIILLYNYFSFRVHNEVSLFQFVRLIPYGEEDGVPNYTKLCALTTSSARPQQLIK
jgi:hypothetical protein